MSNTTTAPVTALHLTVDGHAACHTSVTKGLVASTEGVTCGRCKRLALFSETMVAESEALRAEVTDARAARKAAKAELAPKVTKAAKADHEKVIRDYTNVYRATRKNRVTGTMVTVATAEALGLDTAGGKWVVVCEDHSVTACRPTRNTAIAASPMDFCDECRAAAKA